MRLSRAINLTGAIATAVVLLIVVYTKVAQGAWIAIIAMIVIFAMMKAISWHYRAIATELDVAQYGNPGLPARNHALILVSKLHLPTMRAIAYAQATRPDTVQALTIQIDEAETAKLLDDWGQHDIDVPLIILESPYREVTKPLLDYVRRLRRDRPRDVVTVFLPEYVVGRWWEQLLHNQSALRLKARLLFEPGVMLTSVPWQLRSSRVPPQRIAQPSQSSEADPTEAQRAASTEAQGVT